MENEQSLGAEGQKPNQNQSQDQNRKQNLSGGKRPDAGGEQNKNFDQVQRNNQASPRSYNDTTGQKKEQRDQNQQDQQDKQISGQQGNQQQEGGYGGQHPQKGQEGQEISERQQSRGNENEDMGNKEVKGK